MIDTPNGQMPAYVAIPAGAEPWPVGVVICGALSTYGQAGGPQGPRNYLRLISQRGRMEGFVILDFMDRANEAMTAISGWMREGKLKDRVDVVHGLENAPAALARVFSGANNGKQIVALDEHAS